ncbi:hypothetical protein IP91_01129 [Pseudoduganella lurida]|uniref:Uncharacterized protein n=1 Tax=Pseudoduganella lurida TaxID=1036180 RepID=A0A562RLZ0_9BURK|nr:hypothetical protein IP91_01129 [Pseudoduganella lurida]
MSEHTLSVEAAERLADELLDAARRERRRRLAPWLSWYRMAVTPYWTGIYEFPSPFSPLWSSLEHARRSSKARH